MQLELAQETRYFLHGFEQLPLFFALPPRLLFLLQLREHTLLAQSQNFTNHIPNKEETQ